MAGKFIGTQYAESVNKLTDFHNDILNQDFYMFTNSGQKPVSTTFYNPNLGETSLDSGSQIAYDEVGEEAPIRYDKIYGLFMYGMPRLETNLETTDFGMESNELSGESYILPDQFEPHDGAFFTIDHIDGHKWLFKVTDVSMAMLERDQQAWKLNWKLDRTSDIDINKNIARELRFIEATPGTNTRRIVTCVNYDIAKELDEVATNLRNFFYDLYYDKKIQSFSYKYYTEYDMYDPFSIEFIMRHKLMNGLNQYLYLEHITNVLPTFGISYSRSVYSCFEKRDKSKLHQYSYQAQADYINDKTTVFGLRYEQYFELNYEIVHEPNGPFNPRRIIPIMDEELISRIEKEKYFVEDVESERQWLYLNVIIKFFNNRKISLDDIKYFDRIDYTPSERLYYDLLFVIYCLDKYIEELLN